MLEILYDTTTNQVRGWCKDPNQFGNFTPKPEETVVVWDTPTPTFESDWYEVDLVNEEIVGNPGYLESMSTSTHWAKVDSFDPTGEKPLIVLRLWNGAWRPIACYVSEILRERFQAGELVVGDFVLIDFVGGDINKPLAITEIFKTW